MLCSALPPAASIFVLALRSPLFSFFLSTRPTFSYSCTMTTPQTQSDISEKSSITGVVHETQPIVEASPEEVKRLLRRLDTRLVVFVLWSYCIM